MKEHTIRSVCYIPIVQYFTLKGTRACSLLAVEGKGADPIPGLKLTASPGSRVQTRQ